MRKNTNLLDFKLLLLYLALTLFFLCAESQTSSNEDAEVMSTLKKSLNAPDSLGWSDPDPCKWSHVGCSETKRVIRIQIGHQNLQGTLPPDLQYLSELERLELQWNNISGPVPSLNGLSSLQVLMLSNNGFTSVPKDFFGGLTSLQSVEIDNNPFSAWEIPENLKNASSLQNFSANSANITGQIPGFLGPDVFPGLSVLHLAFNNLVGSLPDSFSGSQIQSLWVNGQKSGSKLSGGIDVVQNMTSLKEIWLHSNSFSGPLPDLSGLKELESLSLRDNFFTGPVPVSLTNLESLKAVNLTNNLLQGSVPVFKPSVSLDITKDSNSFCLPTPGKCDPKIDTLLSVAKAMSYPRKFAENWKGNDPCADWIGITCSNGFITIVNFQKMNLSGTIPPDFSSLKSLQRLVLANNNLTGTIPEELTSLVSLKQLDVSNNNLFGKVPPFTSNVMVNTSGNPDIGKNKSSSLRQGTLPGGPTSSKDDELSHTRETKILRIFLTVFGILLGILLIVGFVYWLHRKKQKRELRHAMCRHNATEVHPRRSGSDNEKSKATAEGSRGKVPETSDKNGIQMVEAGNLKFSIEVLRNVTNNFSQNNILGQGGFGTVYKGELHDGTLVAVKRMDGGVMSGKGSSEFQSEIDVLTTVRHRNLVSLLGYCLDGAEKLLVYEYMPQGTLTRHLLCWAEEGLNPLEWKRRLTIALDVAKGVEYLHSLAQKSFIHRDLKPSNILLGDDMRAKVSDFGLVRLAPEGKGSVVTRVAGTFGYLAPEYAVTGRITVKIDVYSFGVILMELITGRKALDETQPEDNMHLVTWFRRMLINEDTFRKAIDPIIDLTEETLTSVRTVSELAGHCTAREPGQRPEMAHAVNVLSSLVGNWKPSEQSFEDSYGIDLDMSLPQAVKKWQAYEGRSYLETSSSSLLPSMDNTQTSIPTRPHGFADSFTSADGR